MRKASKKRRGKDFEQYALKGDKLLTQLARKFAKSRMKRQKKINWMQHNLVQNKYISRFDIHWQAKDKNGQVKKYSNPGMIGDMVEAWLWFLNVNYGEKVAYRYFQRQVIKHIPEINWNFKQK